MVKTSAKTIAQATTQSHFYPPVVAVLGHVDHGKTTLLDAIRKTNLAQKEHGGITQAIGASKIEFIHEGIKRQITFIDTPGHEAFAKMRGRGTDASDIGLLVVSSVDGVMPQTKESIRILYETKVPFIVVVTKSDLPNKNPEKVKQQLLKEGVMLEGYGGDVPIIEVSAKTNTNIKELLELILLVFEVKAKSPSPSENGQFKAIVIESKLDQKRGPRATIVIKEGLLSVGDKIFCEGAEARVRTVINDKGEHLDKAFIGDAVEILGFEKVLSVGSVVLKKPIEAARASVAASDAAVGSPTVTLAPPLTDVEKPSLPVIICADTLGSLEAIVNALPKEIFVFSQKTGTISPADIIFAKSVNAVILGFNTKINPEVLKLAALEKVLVKNYNLVYELLDEINDVLKGRQLEVPEEIFGKAKVLASFPFEKTKVLGITVQDGRVARGDKVRLIRKDEIIGESRISSMRVGKDPVSKVEKGHEAGVILFPFLDFTIGDMLVCHG
jgi:translation initiation factor IF-2